MTDEKKVDKPLEAYFVSKHSELEIWIKPDDEFFYPNGTRRTVPGSGKKINFNLHHYHTADPEIIEHICNMEEFKNGLEIFPDPSDPSGYWEQEGYFKRVDQKDVRVPTNKMKSLMSEAQNTMSHMVKTAAMKTTATR